MNPYSGHLINLGDDTASAFAKLGESYSAIPERLKADAEKELAGRSEAYVDLHAKSRLSDWAKTKRKAKIAAKSKRINRR